MSRSTSVETTVVVGTRTWAAPSTAVETIVRSFIYIMEWVNTTCVGGVKAQPNRTIFLFHLSLYKQSLVQHVDQYVGELRPKGIDGNRYAGSSG